MFKRLFWLTVGASVGFGSSWWVTRTVKRKIECYAPKRLTTGVAHTAQAIAGEVMAAMSDGRSTMRQREAELRSELDARYAPRERRPQG